MPVKTSIPKKGSDYIKQSSNALKINNEKSFNELNSLAVAYCPYKYKPFHNKAVFLRHKGLFKHAELVLDLAFKHAEKEGVNLDSIIYEAAQVAAKQKKYDQAYNYLDLLNSPIASSEYNKGIFALKAGNYTLAIEELNESTDSKSNWALGIAHFFLMDFEDAIYFLDKSYKAERNPEVALTKAHIFLESGKKEEAIVILKKLTANNKVKERAKQYLASLLISIDKIDEAKTFLPDLSKADSYNSLVCWGSIYLKESKNDSSLQIFKRANKINPIGVEALIGLGYNCLILKRYTDSDKWFNEVLAISPNNIIALEGAGFLHFNIGQFSKSLTYFNTAISIKGEYNLSYNALFCIGYINRLFGQNDEAIIFFKIALEKSNDNVWSHLYLGYCLYDERNYNQALFHFNAAYKQSSENDHILSCIGITETRLKMSESAVLHLEDVISRDSINIFALNSLAFSYSELNKHKEAVNAMTKVRNLAPYNKEYLINSGLMESNAASYFKDISNEDSVNYHLEKMNNFYNEATLLGADDNVLNINKGYGYCMTAVYDTAVIFYNKVNNEYFDASINNNIGVVNALEEEYSKAEFRFNKATDLLKEEHKELKNNVAKNLEYSKSGSPAISLKKKYTSIVYFYIFTDKESPILGNQFNIQTLEIKHQMPEEVYTDLVYTDNVFCETETRTKLVPINPKRPAKQGKECPKF